MAETVRRRVNFASAIGVALVMGTAVSGEERPRIPLQSLKDGCWIESAPTPIGHYFGAWLRCGPERVLLTHQLNLLGLVKIETSEQALEFLRFFTARDSYRLFPAIKNMEIVPGPETERGVLEEQQFRKICTPAAVKEFPRTNDGKRVFEATRSVLFLDDKNIYEVTEVLHEDGLYVLTKKRLLFKDVSKLGLLYFPM